MLKPKDVTIIIPHLGGSPEAEYALTECLLSLRETFSGKIILAKNGNKSSIDCRHFGDIEIINQGQCKAVNAAAAIVNTPFILITNDDMIYPPGWFEKLTENIDPKASTCLSPKLVEPRPGAPTFISHFCGGAGGDFDKQKFLDFVESYPQTDLILSTGFNLPLLISKELWDTVGGYDINYDPWSSNSDSDLEYKIRLAGVQPYQVQNCLVYHFSQTSGTFEPRNRGFWEKNWSYFIEKWGFPRTDDGIWEATFVIPDEGRIFRPDWEGKYGY
jgi:GT2 family glycosyltransferase